MRKKKKEKKKKKKQKMWMRIVDAQSKLHLCLKILIKNTDEEEQRYSKNIVYK